MVRNSDLRDEIRRIRIEKNWTQRKMARLLKVHEITLAKWERRKMGIAPRTEFRVRKVLSTCTTTH